MNVRIAAQTLSSSVASAIDFLWEQTDLPEFKGSEATTHFIKQVDMIFDMLNSRNPFVKGYKAPVTKENLSLWLKQCDKVLSNLLLLRDQRQKLLIEGCHKTVIWVFTFSIHSLVAVAWEYLSCEHCPLEYILTYKFSQVHIELLFNKICCRYGWNNSPNVLQFMYTLRRLLIRTVLNHLILGTAVILMMHCVSQIVYFISLQSGISTKKPQLITMTMKRIVVVKEC